MDRVILLYKTAAVIWRGTFSCYLHSLSLYSAIIEVLRPSDDSFVNPPMMKTLFSVDVVANIEILGYKSRLKITIFYYLLFARIKWVISNDIPLLCNIIEYFGFLVLWIIRARYKWLSFIHTQNIGI